MLYTVGMNEKPNLPEEIMFGPAYSLRANLKANTWAFVAMLLSLAGDELLARYNDWGAVPRVIIAMVPLLVSLFWVRGFVRWVRGMDELHRRVTLGAFLFGTTLYLAFNAGWPLLIRADIFSALNLTRWHLERMPFYNCTFTICLTYLFSGLGYAIFNRRYK